MCSSDLLILHHFTNVVSITVQPALVQHIVHKFPRQAVEGRKERHADDHAHKTEQVAADHDGKQDPQGRDADGRAQDLRADEVAVHLLDDQNQHAEDDRLDRVNQQQNEDAGDRADEGAKYRDNIRDADKHTDEQCKIEPQDRHCHKRDNADDGRVNDLAHKEAREIHVGIMADAQRVFRSLFRQEGMRQRAQLMEQMLDEMTPSFVKNELQVEFLHAEHAIFLEADGELLARLFGNLLNNAVKYGKEGKQVRVSMEKEGEYVVTRVINYGRIIPKQELDHIFQKFYRTEQSRSRDTGGTGLGLAIVQQIAELHHGQVRVKSDLQGTVFEVELPVGMPKGKKEDEKR